MTDMERMLIERECERLALQYASYIDRGEAARIADLFTEDAEFVAVRATMKGRTAIVEGMGHRESRRDRRSRHVCTNILIDVTGETTATGTVYMTVYRHDDPEDPDLRPSDIPASVGDYRDRYERTSDGWRISRREIVPVFVRSMPRPVK